MTEWRVTFATEGRGLRTFQVPAFGALDAEDAGRLLLTLEAVDAELVSLEVVDP